MNAGSTLELDKKVPGNETLKSLGKTRLNELIKADFVFIK